jgi:hypothetical protein
MRRHTLFAVLVVGVVAMLMLAPSAVAVQRFELTMTGAQEAPGPGDPDGSGTASFTFNRGRGEVCFALEVEDIVLPATGAHIHLAPAGDPGPVVIPLTAPGTDGTSSGCVSADRDLIKAITKDPSAYYVNVHTTDFPAGAVRAQLG